MKIFAWARFVLWEVLFSVIAAIVWTLIPHFADQRRVAYSLATALLWAAFTYLNLADLVARIGFANAERNAHRALARNMGEQEWPEMNGAKR